LRTKRLAVILVLSLVASLVIASLFSGTEERVEETQILGSSAGDWSDDMEVSHSRLRSQSPEVAVDGLGNLHFVWSDEKDGSFNIYYKRLSPSGRTLTTERQLTATQTRSVNPSLELDSENRAHIVWMDDGDGGWEFYYTQVNPTGSTSNKVLKLSDNPPGSILVGPNLLLVSAMDHYVDPADAASISPVVAVDGNNMVHVVWADHSRGNFEIFYSKLNVAGTQLVKGLRLTNTPADSLNPTVAVDSAGRAHVAWSEGSSNADLFYQLVESDGDPFSGPVKVVGSQSNGPLDVSIDCDDGGVASLVWSTDKSLSARLKSTELYFVKVNAFGNQVTRPLTISDALSGSENPTVTLGDDGLTYIVWQDDRTHGNNIELYYSILEEDSSFMIRERRLTGAPGLSLSPDVSQRDGMLAVTWFDNRNGNQEVYFKVHQKPADVFLVSRSTVGEDSFVAVALTSFGLLSAIGYLGGTEVGRTSLIGLGFVPLYSRLTKDKLLHHEVREQICDYVRENPGASFTDIMHGLGLKNGSLSYHLRTLERERILQSRRDGSYRRYYPWGASNLPTEIQTLIIREVRHFPGISQSQLARMLGKSRQVINYHVTLLADHGSLAIRKEGRKTACYVRNGTLCA